MSNPSRDLVCLVADKNLEQSMAALLGRYQALGIRQITYDVHVHPERDPGCRLHSDGFLRPFLNRMTYAIVVFDREGCGKEDKSREELESQLENLLSTTGWRERAAVVVIDPELEAWVWSESPHVDSILGWTRRSPDLRSWLRDQGLLDSSSPKPARPKEALEKALWDSRKPRSSAIYRQLAQEVSVAKCVDPAFAKLRETLQTWFAG